MTLPLVLLPGLLNDDALWAHQRENLADIADCRIMDLTRDDSVGQLALAVLAAMPEQFALAGLSMGGYVALEIMRQAPARVIKLALLDTKADPDTPEQTKRRRGLLELAEKGKFKGVTPRLLPMLIHPDRLEDEMLTRDVMAMAERVGRDAFLRQQRAIMTRADSRDSLQRIACPTLVLCGRQDALTPLAQHEAMAQAIPGAELVVVEVCGHLSPMERPEQVTAAMRRWLSGN